MRTFRIYQAGSIALDDWRTCGIAPALNELGSKVSHRAWLSGKQGRIKLILTLTVETSLAWNTRVMWQAQDVVVGNNEYEPDELCTAVVMVKEREA